MNLTTDKIVPVPFPKTVAAVVVIDGVPYAGFESMNAARSFCHLVKGEVDGNGHAMDKPYVVRWQAIAGRQLEAVLA